MSDEEIGDAEPEDRYDDDDPVEEKLTVLELVVDELRERSDDRREFRRTLLLALLERLEERIDAIDRRVISLRERAETL